MNSMATSQTQQQNTQLITNMKPQAQNQLSSAETNSLQTHSITFKVKPVSPLENQHLSQRTPHLQGEKTNVNLMTCSDFTVDSILSQNNHNQQNIRFNMSRKVGNTY